MQYGINKQNAFWILGSVTLIGLLSSLYPVETLSASIIGMSLWILSKKKMIGCLFLISPFILFSFLPTTYVYIFRLNTPVGFISPVLMFIVFQFSLMVTVFYKSVDLSVVKKHKSIVATTVVFFLVGLTSLLFNGSSLEGIKLVSTSFLLSGGVFITVTSSGKLFKDKLLPFKAMVFFSTIVALLGVVEFIFGFQPYKMFYMGNEYANFTFNNTELTNGYLRRIVSSIGNPLVLCTYLLLCIPIIFLLRDRVGKTILWNTILVLHVLAVFLTMSRTGIIAIPLVFFMYWVMKKNFKALLWSPVLVIFFGGLFLAILNMFSLGTNFLDRMLFKSSGFSLTHRLDAFQSVSLLIKDNVFFGIGSGNLDTVLSYLGGSILTIATLDNIFLSVLVENGIIGFIVFTFMIVTVFSTVKRMKSEYRNIGYLLLLVLLIAGFSFKITFFEPVWGVFWIFFSFLVLLNSEKSERLSSSKQDNKARYS